MTMYEVEQEVVEGRKRVWDVEEGGHDLVMLQERMRAKSQTTKGRGYDSEFNSSTAPFIERIPSRLRKSADGGK